MPDVRRASLATSDTLGSERDEDDKHAPSLSDIAPEHVDFARATLKAAYRRAEQRPVLPVGDPIWNILLDLFVSHASDRPVSISSACVASNVPHTTALRNVNILVDAGYVTTRRDSSDARRRIISLTTQGLDWIRDAIRYEMEQTGRLR
jgi:predicted transcriptional regulator